MKHVILTPIPKPKSFQDLDFTADEYAAAVKHGDKVVSFSTARENIKLSKGLYRMKEIETETIEQPKLIPVEDLTKEALVAEMTMFGKAPQKQMSRKVAEDFLRKLRADAVNLISDEGDDE